jgi:hypothetical protein
MRKITFQISVFTLSLSLAGACLGQRKTETITISDPATVSLASPFAQSDIVAFVKIHSGDAQSYKLTLYEAEILDGYKPNHAPYDATKNYFRIMYDGYGIMPVSYECFFDGRDSDKCGYGVKFNTNQVELPATLKAFPKNVGEFSPDKKWVRRDAVKAALANLKNRK